MNDPGMKKIVVFFGLIASGKSFVAKAWSEKHHFPYYNTDVVRKDLAAQYHRRRGKADIDQGIYSPAFSRLTYDALLNLCEEALAERAIQCVVLDGSYHTRDERQRLRSRFEDQAQIVFVFCCCDEATSKSRLAERALDPTAVSDGTWRVYLHQKEVFEEPGELLVRQLLRLATDQPLSRLLELLDTNLLPAK
jgi:hypothetical protein